MSFLKTSAFTGNEFENSFEPASWSSSSKCDFPTVPLYILQNCMGASISKCDSGLISIQQLFSSVNVRYKLQNSIGYMKFARERQVFGSFPNAFTRSKDC